MNESHKEFISAILSMAIIFFSLFIIKRFIPSIIWAGIIVISTYPLYQKWQKLFGSYKNVSALIFTSIAALVLILPLSWLIGILVKEIQVFLFYLQGLNKYGAKAPIFLKQVPLFANDLITYWNDNIGQPGNLKDLLSNIHLAITPASYYIKQIGVNLAHRSFQLGFTFLTLFFFYRDGSKLAKQINFIGKRYLGKRWSHYADGLPAALRSTVNGTMVVGAGVGILMGFCYFFVNFPAPTLTGFITAFAAMVPFLVPIVFMVVMIILFCAGKTIGALIVLVWGTFVMFVADHFIKPVLIGGAIQLPFLAVLFGILGGVETLGILGLFLGPIIMVLFINLWQECQE